ncbi:hypothetical protein DPMN_045875 [Dreissena polymorpha]|uniref:Uncharacterized protein n=1 Tax=Dreissena polymorpha TaxID=45954 RepID=A0A9D4I1S3_DREPO|nr:hypothetical protein DPMN_045875 [Dreissena polymorpha]
MDLYLLMRFEVTGFKVKVTEANNTVQLTQNQQIPRSAEFDDINCSRSRLGIDHLVAESPCLFAETRRGTPRHDAEEIVGDMTLSHSANNLINYNLPGIETDYKF